MPNIKTFNGIASANVKTIRGVAIASIKSFNGHTVVNGPSGPPSTVSATAVGTVNDASNGRLNLVWTNGDATAQTRIYNGATLLATANAAATTYSLTTLAANTAYTLTVKHLKAGVESAGANFSATTTFRYNGDVISTARGTNDDTVGGYSWSGSGYDKISTTANGNNGTYLACPPSDQLSTDYCAFRVVGTLSGNQYDGTYTVPAGVTAIKIFLVGAPGLDGLDNPPVGGGGGGGAIWGQTITGLTEGDTFRYAVGAGEGGAMYSQFYKLNSAGALSPSMTYPGAYASEGGTAYDADAGAGGYARDPVSGNNSNGIAANAGRLPQASPVGAAYGGGGGVTSSGGVGGYSKGYLYGQDSGSFAGILAIVQNP